MHSLSPSEISQGSAWGEAQQPWENHPSLKGKEMGQYMLGRPRSKEPVQMFSPIWLSHFCPSPLPPRAVAFAGAHCLVRTGNQDP